MVLNPIARLAGIFALAGALAGCIDARVDIDLTSETTARATMTQQMGADFYAMLKMGAESGEGGGESFCDEGELTEKADGSAICVMTEEGAFAELSAATGDGALSFTPAGPGLVRISLPTADMKAEIGADEQMDEETRKMVEAFFAGHVIAIRFSGAKVTDTNMTLSADGRSAEAELAFVDILNGAESLPDELYAVVAAP